MRGVLSLCSHIEHYHITSLYI